VLPRRSIFENHRGAADMRGRQIDIHLDTVGDPDEGNIAVDSIILAVEGHCSLYAAGASSGSVHRQRNGEAARRLGVPWRSSLAAYDDPCT